MPRLTFRELARMTGGELVAGADIEVGNVVIDSREAGDDSVFFAIRGERHDGHKFVAEAMSAARGAVLSELPPELLPDRGFVLVDDTLAALQTLARAVRRASSFLLIAVTGSTGKTTTKEMIASLIESERRTWKSWGNFNNHIGFPLCLVNTPDDAEVVVSEMGMSAPGEIEFLARLGEPDVGVYTNIRPVHLEFFESIDGIAAAKRELLENVRPDGTIVLNADDPRVMRIAEGFEGTHVTFGVDSAADYRAVEVEDLGLDGTRFGIDTAEGRKSFELLLPGRHNLENLLAAIATARVVGVSWTGIQAVVSRLKPAAHRGVILRWRGATLIDDTYNSNPWALSRAVELLVSSACSGRRIAVLGDMLELGRDELRFHEEAGRGIPRSVDRIVGVGRRSKSILIGASSSGFPPESLVHFDDAMDAAKHLHDSIQEGDLVLLKGSRGIGLERIVTFLEGGD